MPQILKNSKFWFFLVLVLAAALRFYRLSEYLQFLGDEGRDVLIVKRMIVDGVWTLLGPTASVGGFYTGPIYYYFMLPFLWMSKLDPVGPAVMSALFGVGTIVLIYWFCKFIFNEKVALLASFFAAISPKLTYISRFSWNPNPVPFFSLLTVIFLLLAAKRKNLVYSLLAGVSTGIMVQLHYIDLVFIPIVFLFFFLAFSKKDLIVNGIIAVVGFLLGNSLFLLFELRHGFPNIVAVVEFITRDSHNIAPRNLNPIILFDDTTRRLFEAVLGTVGFEARVSYYLAIFGFVIWILAGLKQKEQRLNIYILLTWFLVGIFGIGLYRGQLLDHYFGYLFPLPYIFLALTGSILLSKKVLLPIFWLGLACLTVLQISHLYFWQQPNNQVEQTKLVDKIVLELAHEEPYNLALITAGNSDHAYRYFLELWGKPPLTIYNEKVDPQRKSVTSQLIVICEQVDCKPLGNPLWEVAGFGRAEIMEKRSAPGGINVFKLVHYDESQKLKVKS